VDAVEPSAVSDVDATADDDAATDDTIIIAAVIET
jgi:hypothetical protein